MIQMSIFSGTEPYRIDKTIRLIELFGGIGAQAKALERLRADFEYYRLCECDTFAVKAYNAIHGTNYKTSDIRHWTGADLGINRTDRYCYIVTWSFPCQSLSIAGNHAGMSKGSGTASSLGWEVIRLLQECDELPQLLVMENVPQIMTNPNFARLRRELDRLGYSNYYEILNAKHYGVPQNRKRCFMVSVLGGYCYGFPPRIQLQQRLCDRLEHIVDKKYYLGEKAIKYVNDPRRLGKYTRIDAAIAGTVTAKSQQNWTGDFVSDSIIVAGRNTKQKKQKGNRIRKLTPKECWRLMDFDDEDYERAKAAGISDSQLYKQAGNSIVVSVLESVFRMMRGSVEV